jgi:hypothetical protein
MDAKTYCKISLINMAFLVAGIWIGQWHTRVVHAQQDFEDIAPNITTGSLGVGKLLAGKIATDELTIQGVDILKLQ